jgi:hypothetical protein
MKMNSITQRALDLGNSRMSQSIFLYLRQIVLIIEIFIGNLIN